MTGIDLGADSAAACNQPIICADAFNQVLAGLEVRPRFARTNTCSPDLGLRPYVEVGR